MTLVLVPIQLQKHTPPTLSPAQKTFQRLKKKIARLQHKSKAFEKELEDCLLFHHNHILPAKKILAQILKKLVVALYGCYKEDRTLAHEERHVLKKILLNKVNLIFQSSTYNDKDPEITAIFENLKGISYDEVVSNELDELKDEMREMFKKNAGVDIDLSSLDKADDESEILRKLFEAMNAAKANIKEEIAEERISRPKSRKQLQKEQQEKELEALQKRELSIVYRQLAKALHPDLEQDPEKKAEKEMLMKRLTSAYEKDDIHSLLLLEVEWVGRSSTQANVRDDDRMMIYNSLLKNQIAALEKQIQMSVCDPRYLSLQTYMIGGDFNGLSTLHLTYQGLHRELTTYQKMVEDLQNKKATKLVRALIKKAAERSSMMFVW